MIAGRAEGDPLGDCLEIEGEIVPRTFMSFSMTFRTFG
jgi:hypothetical protein